VTKIPFNRPAAMGRELDCVTTAVETGSVGGAGQFAAKCQAVLEKEVGAKKALLTTSCTAALEMAALLIDAQPGDEIILPSFTFASTANAFALRGAKPVFVDIRPDTLNLDEKQIERRLTERTKAIVAVHYAGVGCEMDAIVDLVRERSIALIEDNALGLFGKYKGRNLGTFGCLATQSFHETKNISCGEGGALLINDERLIERAEMIREKGTNRARFFRGEVDKYTWVDLGSSYAPSDILAAYLLAQLEVREKIQKKREDIWNFYAEHLPEWAERCGARLPVVPSHTDQTYHMFYVLMKTGEDRDRLMAHLREAGIQSVFHYLPLHLSKMGQSFGGKAGDCPVTESISERLLRLPFYNTLTTAELSRVVEAMEKFRPCN
jgi:dTDP-4-amino-4,6-dideoxygalactose transaminase